MWSYFSFVAVELLQSFESDVISIKWREKMIILREYKWLQKIMGLNPQGGLENIILQMVYLVPLFTCDVMFSIYFALNISENSYRAMTALPGCFAFTVLIATYSHLVTRRERLYLLIDELHGIVNESTKPKLHFSHTETDSTSDE